MRVEVLWKVCGVDFFTERIHAFDRRLWYRRIKDCSSWYVAGRHTRRPVDGHCSLDGIDDISSHGSSESIFSTRFCYSKNIDSTPIGTSSPPASLARVLHINHNSDILQTQCLEHGVIGGSPIRLDTTSDDTGDKLDITEQSCVGTQCGFESTNCVEMAASADRAGTAPNASADRAGTAPNASASTVNLETFEVIRHCNRCDVDCSAHNPHILDGVSSLCEGTHGIRINCRDEVTRL